MNFDPVFNAHELQASAHGRMLDQVISGDVLHLRIGNAAVIFEKRRQPTRRDVTGFVDGGQQNGAAVLTVPNRVIGAAAEKGNAEWGTSNNQGISPGCRSVRQ